MGITRRKFMFGGFSILASISFGPLSTESSIFDELVKAEPTQDLPNIMGTEDNYVRSLEYVLRTGERYRNEILGGSPNADFMIALSGQEKESLEFCGDVDLVYARDYHFTYKEGQLKRLRPSGEACLTREEWDEGENRRGFFGDMK